MKAAKKKAFTYRLLSDGYSTTHLQPLVICTPSSCISKQSVYDDDDDDFSIVVIVVIIDACVSFVSCASCVSLCVANALDDDSCKRSFCTRSK